MTWKHLRHALRVLLRNIRVRAPLVEINGIPARLSWLACGAEMELKADVAERPSLERLRAAVEALDGRVEGTFRKTTGLTFLYDAAGDDVAVLHDDGFIKVKGEAEEAHNGGQTILVRREGFVSPFAWRVRRALYRRVAHRIPILRVRHGVTANFSGQRLILCSDAVYVDGEPTPSLCQIEIENHGDDVPAYAALAVRLARALGVCDNPVASRKSRHAWDRHQAPHPSRRCAAEG